jgi:hypothetical protein
MEAYAEKRKAEAKEEILEDKEYDEKIRKASQKIIDTAEKAYKKIYPDKKAADKALEYFDAIQEAIDNAKTWNEVGFYDINQEFGLTGGITNVTKLYQITKQMNNEFAAVDKKFDPIFKKTKKLSEYDIDEIVVTGTIKDKKDTHGGDTDEKGDEARFKARLEQLEQQQREERNIQTRAYVQGKIDREEYNTNLASIDFIYLFKRKELYIQFGKETSEIDGQILNSLAKITDTVYERMEKTNTAFLKFVKQGKDELDKLAKEANNKEKETANEFNDYLNSKADEANKLSDELNANNISEQMQRELDALEELHNLSLISEEEYENARMAIKMKALQKYIKKAQQMMEAASGMVNAMQDAEVARVEADEQQKLQVLQQRRNQGLIAEEDYNAEKEKIEHDAAQKKLDIEKKYADVNFAMKIAEIIANTGVAIMTAFSQLGPIGGAIAAAMLTVTGALQIAAAKAERDKVKAMTLDSASGSSAPTQQRVVMPGIEEGGYTDVEREQDGKIFSARKRKRRGYADKPTVLIGEDGAEFVANADAVRNPTIRPVLDLINIAQQNGSISSINLPKIVSSMYGVRGYESGGYTSTPTAAPSAKADVNIQETAAVMKEVRDLLSYLKNNGVDAWVVLSQLQKQQALLEKSQKLGSRG